MNATLSADQLELGAVIRRFLAEHSPESEVRRLMDDPRGWNPEFWKLAADQMGLQGLAVPECYGGSGFGLVELGVVFEELGRSLTVSPFLTSVGLASHALLASSDEEACEEYLPKIASGDIVATLAVIEGFRPITSARLSSRAEHSGGQWRISGDQPYVLDGHTADLLLIVAHTEGGIGLFAVDAYADGLARFPLATLDPTRRLARVELRDTPARLIGDTETGWLAVEHALRVGSVLLAAEQVGGTGRVVDMAVKYARERSQFGRPIGSFQAIKHKCADMLVELEASRSAAFAGLTSVADASANQDIAVSVAKAYCSEAYSHCAAENLHVHGGIGFTWEHSAHLYLKRARSSEILLGSPAFHLERIAALVWQEG